MLKYVFNEHGVCVNPTVPFRLKDDSCLLEISVAEFSGKWGYAINFNIYFGSHMGSSWGVQSKRCNYDTEKAALLAATDDAVDHIRKEKERQEPQFLPKFKCFSPLFQYHESLRQLSIF